MKIIAGIVDIIALILIIRVIVAALKEKPRKSTLGKILFSSLIGTLLCGSALMLPLVSESGDYKYISIILVDAGTLAVCLGIHFIFKSIRKIETDNDDQDNKQK